MLRGHVGLLVGSWPWQSLSDLPMPLECSSDAVLASLQPGSTSFSFPGVLSLCLPSEPSSPGPAASAREKSDFLLLLCHMLLQAGTELP